MFYKFDIKNQPLIPQNIHLFLYKENSLYEGQIFHLEFVSFLLCNLDYRFDSLATLFNLSFAISQYSLLQSNPRKFLFNIFAILQVVPEPENISRIKSPSLLHEIIWSAANFSGYIAGCLYAISSLVQLPFPTAYSQILYLIPNSSIFLSLSSLN